MKRDSMGKSISESANDYGFYSKMLEKPFDTLEDLKEAEAKVLAQRDAKTKEKELRQADAEAVQNSAQNYLNLVSKNNTARAELKKAEEEAYATYKAQLDDFAQKHNGYHLTFTREGDNVEFKVEESRADSWIDYFKEQQQLPWKILSEFPWLCALNFPSSN